MQLLNSFFSMTPTIDIEDSSQLVMYLRDTSRIGSREEPIVNQAYSEKQ